MSELARQFPGWMGPESATTLQLQLNDYLDVQWGVGNLARNLHALERCIACQSRLDDRVAEYASDLIKDYAAAQNVAKVTELTNVLDLLRINKCRFHEIQCSIEAIQQTLN